MPQNGENLGKTRNSRTSRQNHAMRRRLDLRLKDYSLAAAGAGALALAPPAQATIVSSTPNTTLTADTPIAVPIAGFPSAIGIVEYSNEFSSGVSLLAGSANPAFFGVSNGGIAPAPSGQQAPGTLHRFTGDQNLVFSSEGGSNSNFAGTNEYVGFSVGTGASIHYGWIKLSITQMVGGYHAVLNQVAIEECATQPITIGTSSGGANCTPATPAPNSLWMLSLGVAGLAGLETLRRLRSAA